MKNQIKHAKKKAKTNKRNNQGKYQFPTKPNET